LAQVRLDRVAKVFPDGTQAVWELSLEIPDGELMVFVGPSGCGKTTALRMIAGLEEVTAGEIWIGERVVNALPPRERDVAMVFQNYALYPHKTVFENLAFPLKLRGLAKRDVGEHVRRIARLLELEEHLNRRPRHLSGGQRQRVAMGRAIVRAPQAFLMDEPLSNLDAKLRTQMRAEISHLHRELGVTMIYVTHDQVEAMTLGDRVAVMRKGELQQVGSPQEIYAHPVNVFVAGFIGSPAMNFVEAELARDGDRLVVRFGDERLEVDERERAERPALGSYVGRGVIVGIRPESLGEGSAVSEDGRRRFRGHVVLREDLGPEVIVHLGVAAVPAVTDEVIELTEDMDQAALDDLRRRREERYASFLARLPAEAGAIEGEPVELAIKPGALHFFDAETGSAIFGERSA
jgi:multiple sugar transport system ATP-binding protein